MRIYAAIISKAGGIAGIRTPVVVMVASVTMPPKGTESRNPAASPKTTGIRYCANCKKRSCTPVSPMVFKIPILAKSDATALLIL